MSSRKRHKKCAQGCLKGLQLFKHPTTFPQQHQISPSQWNECRLRRHSRLAKAAVVDARYSYFSSIPKALQNDEEIARLAIERDPRDLRYVTDKQLIEKLVAEDPNLCHFIPSEDDHHPDFSAF